MMAEPVMTWNFFQTPIVVAVAVLMLGHWLEDKNKKRWEGWEKYNLLKAETERVERNRIDRFAAAFRPMNGRSAPVRFRHLKHGVFSLFSARK